MIWLGPLLWYLNIIILGLAALPIAFAFFPALRDRGYTFSRTLGLLLWAFGFWLLSSLGVLPNTIGGYLFAFLLLLGASAFYLKRVGINTVLDWFRQYGRVVLTVELLFAAMFVFVLLLRGMEPAAVGTEKPMELAFINSILRSPSMPPRDPWLADYSISYYYFGYVIVAMLAKFSGISGGVAFNMGSAMVYALGAIGTYGLVYNMLAAARPEKNKGGHILALLAPVFVFLVSNVEGFLEFLHGRGVFWTQNPDGSWTSDFWRKLDILNLVDPPPGNTVSGQLRYYWWWRASRVVSDYRVDDSWIEIIDEFPFFSMFLGDLHPHVLVIPFVMLAMALALNLILSKPEDLQPPLRIDRFEFLFSPEMFVLGGIVFGGLGFLNLWDFPWYVGVFAGAHLIKKIEIEGWHWSRIVEFIVLGIAYGITGVLLYLPFYLSFASQAGGILPNVVTPTRGAHLWVMFGTLFVPLFIFMAFLYLARRRGKSLLRGLALAGGGAVVLFILSLSLVIVFSRFTPEGASYLLDMYRTDSLQNLLKVGLSRRLASLFGLLTLVGLVGGGLGLLWPKPGEEKRLRISYASQFAALLVVIGTLLVLVPEFIYLKDLFGTRMNTIFKFYYQTWMMLGLAAAYGSAVLLSERKWKAVSGSYVFVLAAVLFVGLTYPAMALDTRVSSFQAAGNRLELDGAAHFYYMDADEKAAAAWLSQAPIGTLVESVGGSYSQHARFATHTGQPNLLGWIGHEGQWRGDYTLFSGRQDDIYKLYTTRHWEEAIIILRKYNIRYVVVGNLEKSTYSGEGYQLEEEKFAENLKTAFQQGSVTIYETPGWDE